MIKNEIHQKFDEMFAPVQRRIKGLSGIESFSEKNELLHKFITSPEFEKFKNEYTSKYPENSPESIEVVEAICEIHNKAINDSLS
ncbi:hypothetical protein [Paenimyroides baculatum]|uniref:Uncharacterized protein n=1 Tax=Paenimyroides baculatum TaxID=2608000 RepID=A0A5M6CS97_9FLAO|nr:hypothetical protein [Paenimyroides baculatum]KAA5538074.1 hypothetical protein F0460_00265 [Paenimyroides baculatum]